MNRRDFIKSLGLTAAAVHFGGVDALAKPTPLPGATGETLTTSGWSSGDTLNSLICVGDVFTIDGYQAINPLTRKPTQHPQLFVVTAITESESEYRIDFHPNPRDIPKRHKKRFAGTH